MSQEWIIDPRIEDSVYESQYHWVIKGTNQLLQSIDALVGNGNGNAEEATIEFTSNNEAVILLGDRKFHLSRQPVDFLV